VTFCQRLCDVGWQRSLQSFRILAFVLIRNFGLELFLYLRVFYVAPAVIDLAGIESRSSLRSMLRVLVAFDLWREERELIAFLVREFSAQLARVVIAIHINLLALFAAVFTDFLITSFEIGPAAVSAPTLMAEVRAVDRLSDDGDVSLVPIDASAA
jgi:hypothetical protein